MTGMVVEDRDEGGIRGRPGQAARKRVAVELVRDYDRPLRWTAHRYSICAEDAEDAYQRGIEILLSKAPTTEIQDLLPWTRTVIKHEALAIRKLRERTLAGPARSSVEADSADDWVQLLPSGDDGPDELAVRRERVARSKEALALLKPAELKALTQLAEGFSYREIAAMNQWSRTKVNRCLAEGRARFRSAFEESESGERCAEFEPLLSACCDDELSGEQLGDLENHLAVCGTCRSTLRAFRAAPKAAAALGPMLPAGGGIWGQLQEWFVAVQVRVQGIGGSSDSAVQTVVASGGARGAGIAVAAKLAAVCAGTAGTAAVCVATGVLPGGELLPVNREKPPVSRPAPAEASERINVERPAAPVRSEPPSGDGDRQPGEPSRPDRPEPAVQAQVADPPAPAPEPAPTESEFTPETAGTPMPSSAPPPKPRPSPVPIGNGGSEFSP